MTIGEVAKLFRLSNRTLRYYEEKGILKPHYIGENGYRYYDPNQLLLLEMIRCFRRLDISLEDIIKELTDVQDSTRVMVLNLFLQEERQIANNIKAELEKQEYVQKVIREIRFLQMSKEGEIQTIERKGCQKVKFYVDSIDSEEEREVYFRTVMSYISQELGEDYPMLSGMIRKEDALQGQYGYSYVEYDSRKDFMLPDKKKLYLNKKEIHICSEKIPSETCIMMVYDTVWEALPKYYRQLFQFAKHHHLELKEELRETWVMPRTEEGEIRIWGRLEFPLAI